MSNLIPPASQPATQVAPTGQMLSVEEFKAALPATLKKSINQTLIDQINQTMADPDFYEQYRENLLSYTKVMQEGKFKVTNYLSAVKYVSYKLMGKTNMEAYTLVFPDKILRFHQQQVSDKDISSYVCAYNKSKLVNLIYEQTLIPVHVLNMDVHQKAINHLAYLMSHANSEMVQMQAAKTLVETLKPPEVQKVELDIGVKEDSAIAQLRKATMELAAAQRDQIKAGMFNAQEIAHSRVIQGETIEDGEIVDE